MFAALCRLMPALRRRVWRSVEAVRQDAADGLVERWYDQWRGEMRERISRLRSADLGSLSDQQLAEHFRAAVALHERGNQIHFMLQGALYLIVGEFAFCCRDLLGWDEEKTFGLLSGLSTTSTEPARQLGELARILSDTGDETSQRFVTALRSYQDQFCCRALCLEVAEPTLAEVPSLTMSLIRDQIARKDTGGTQDQQREAARAEARASLARRPAGDLARFERLLTRAERAYPVREDNEFYTISAPLALVRYAALETGRRLASRGAINHADDIFFLDTAEAPRALSGYQNSWADLVARRRGEQAWVHAHPGPQSYGHDPGPPPAFDALPAEARLAMQALMWSVDRMLAQDRSQLSQPASATLEGLAASPGRYTGPARIISSESQLAKLRPGDVLVCRVTSPVWSMLFPNVGALVTRRRRHPVPPRDHRPRIRHPGRRRHRQRHQPHPGRPGNNRRRHPRPDPARIGRKTRDNTTGTSRQDPDLRAGELVLAESSHGALPQRMFLLSAQDPRGQPPLCGIGKRARSRAGPGGRELACPVLRGDAPAALRLRSGLPVTMHA